MPPQAVVPDELRRSPFKGSVAREQGLLTARQLDGKTWTRLLPDVYVHQDVEVTDAVRLSALNLAVPEEAVIAGLTAAWLHGVWRPMPGNAVPLHLIRPHAASGSGLVGRFVRRRGRPDQLEPVDLIEQGGLIVTSPLRTCWDLMRGRSLVESVVVLDAFAFATLVELPVVAAYVDAWRRWPGVRAARTAVSLASARSASPGETRMRMVVVLAGFPQPYVNVPFESAAGTWVFDLLLFAVPRPVGLEYDGAYHFEDAQHGRDLRRENSIQIQGDIPLLRYDGRSVLVERHLMVSQLEGVSGYRHRNELDDRDFERGPKSLRW